MLGSELPSSGLPVQRGFMMQLGLLRLLILAAVVVCLDACKDLGEADTGILLPGGVPATFSYKGYSADGSLAVTGTMSLTVAADSSVSGTWNLDAVSSSDKVGPQVGSGTLFGSVLNGSIAINLNPGWADNNIFLFGAIAQDRFTGRWTWDTFVGPTASGMFEATKKL